MVGHLAVAGDGRTQSDGGLVERAAQRLEQGVLRRAAALSVAGILAPVRNFRNNRVCVDCRRSLFALSAQVLQIRWRRWLTERYLRHWLDEQAYYRMQLNRAVTDNPDQRISDDLDAFAASTLALSLGLLSSVVTLVSFLSILWTLSGALVIPLGGIRIAIPGYMVFAALIYAVAGTFLTHRVGNPLVRLNFDQQRYEADFRFSLVRLRENAEN